MSAFSINFFELMFLAEACIQPTPIARHGFWYDLCDKHYRSMSNQERNRAFEWIQSSPKFNKENVDNFYFCCRFDPSNQYIVTTKDDKKIEAFLAYGEYFIKRNTTINPDFIKKVEKYERPNNNETTA